MKLVFVYNASSGSAATMLQAFQSLNIFSSISPLSAGNTVKVSDITSVGDESDTLIFFHALNSTDNLKSVAQQLLASGYAVCVNLSESSTPTNNLLYAFSLTSNAITETNTAINNFQTVNNSILTHVSATESSKKVTLRSGSNNALIGEIQLAGTSSDYTHVGFTTDSSKSSFGFFPRNSTIAGSKISGVLINAGALFFNSSKPAGGDLGNFLKDLAEFCTHKGITAKYKVTGSTLNSKQEPVSRKIRIYNKKSGTLLAETISASDGTYSLDLITQDTVYVVCLHDQADTNNSQIQDDIIPILVE